MYATTTTGHREHVTVSKDVRVLQANLLQADPNHHHDNGNMGRLELR